MNPLKIYLHLSSLTFSYDAEDTKQLSWSDDQKLRAFLDQNNIVFEARNGKLFIEKGNLPFSFFKNKEEFVHQVTLSHFDTTIIIQEYSAERVVYYDPSIVSEELFQPDEDDFFIANAKAYLISKDFFKNSHSHTNENFEFVDFYSDSSKTITFASISEKKRVKFKFSAKGCIELDPKINFLELFIEFKGLFEENKHYPIFLKTALIKILTNEENSKYESFFQRLEQIISEAELNFNVYLHELSIDKIKAEYKEYKQKYFSSQNEILNKLTTQVIALPLSISGTVFAISKLEREVVPLTIVGFGLICYVGYVTFLIKIFSRDIGSMQKQSSHDYKHLSEQPFFNNNEDELNYFNEIKTSISERLIDLFKGLKIFTLIMWITSGLIILYLINNFIQVESPIKISFFAIGFSAILAAIHSYILFDKNILAED